MLSRPAVSTVSLLFHIMTSDKKCTLMAISNNVIGSGYSGQRSRGCRHTGIFSPVWSGLGRTLIARGTVETALFQPR
ncbi:hypothetical protein ACQV2C_00150 [Pantoea allii]|uniref:hypothetical protein n=1 Tax=Pantoea allii TaxID=574096 RepID=UPI000A2448DC|nr:hypothetical protein HA38_15130 [Pantoea allii]PBJ98379.1 hypothetical protein CMR03_21005 [Pantoea allii]